MSELPVIVYSMRYTRTAGMLKGLRALGYDCQLANTLIWDDLAKSSDASQHTRTQKYLSKLFFANKGCAVWKFVTPIREPVARIVDQQIKHVLDHAGPEMIPTDPQAPISAEEHQPLVEQISQNIHETLRNFDPQKDDTYLWFENCFYPILGVDVFTSGFHRENGYQIFYVEDGDILLIKTEMIHENITEAMYEFLSIRDFTLPETGTNEKEAVSNSFAALRARILGQIQIPRDILEPIYESDYVTTFYTEEEIENFLDKWTGQGRSVEHYLQFGQKLMTEGDALGALLNYERAIEKDPACVTAYNEMGKIYKRAGQVARAAQNFLNALQLDPQSKQTLDNCVEIMDESGYGDQAQRLAESFLDPSDQIPTPEPEENLTEKNQAAQFLDME